MAFEPRLRNPLLAAALLACATSAWAAYEYNSSYVPAVTESSRVASGATPLAAEPRPTANEQGLAPNETVVATEQPAAPARSEARIAAPLAQAPAEPIEITKPRLTDDQRIQADVMEVLATNPTLSGKIGVVSEDRVVTLTGYTLTSGQAWRAGRDAGRVQGVRHVVNEIRPRVGGISS